MHTTACHPASLLRYTFIGLIRAIYLYGETANRNRYTIPKTKTLVKKIVPISAFSFLTITAQNREERGVKNSRSIGIKLVE